jgi:sugar phosphate isomerase/epimerase
MSMTSRWSRRQFLRTLGAAAAIPAGVRAAARAARPDPRSPSASPFKLSVLTDELDQDLDHACSVAAKEFGLGFVELREVWSKNAMRLDAKEVEEAKRILDRYSLRVSAIASPVFKVDWAGAPKSPFSPKVADFKGDFTFQQQDELLERAFELTRVFGTTHLRIFDFWRLDDPSPYRAAMDDKLREAAAKAGKRGVTLVLENEYACNTATSAEALRTLKAVTSPFLKLNWDPGNAAMRGDVPFPDGYRMLPKDRIGHVHVKNVARKEGGGFEWAEMGKGFIDWVGQFRALKADGYRDIVTLETHWRGAGTPEASTRECWASMSRQLREAGALGS